MDSVAPRPVPVQSAGDVRAEYTSARLIGLNLEHRKAGRVLARQPGYLPPEIDYVLRDGSARTMAVRDSDLRFLDRVPAETAVEHVDLIHRARWGEEEPAAELARRGEDAFRDIASRFAGQVLSEDRFIIPYTSTGAFTEEQISHKGAMLLDLQRRGFATADFNLLSAATYDLTPAEVERCARAAIRNLEVLSGRQLGSARNPLLMAMRSAVPAYIPGFMPTYLNVGLTPEILPGLPARYGLEGAARIRLNSRKTLLEALDPDAYASAEADLEPGLTLAENEALCERLEALVARRRPDLLTDAFAQVRFFLDKAYQYYAAHLGVLRNFMRRETHLPSVIFQRMVCSVIDDRSYAGVLYSRHPRQGSGVFLQYARTVFGEDLMTGRLAPEERHLLDREDARRDFPAVYHFWNRLTQLEDILRGPVMVEFTAVHGTFTILQVDAAELTGSAMLAAVMDLHRAGRISADRVRELIKPYHVRQIESDAIDPRSILALQPFGRGVAVLPRSAVTGRLAFSVERTGERGGGPEHAPVILAKERFTPQDAIDMQQVRGICSLSPAAIHVVTTAQNLGIPALLDLEEDGVRIDPDGRRLVNAAGLELREGDWVTISSLKRTLFAGRAVFAPARLLRFMAGEPVEITEAERPRFERLAGYYRDYRRILESVDAGGFESLQDLGHAIRYGELRGDPARATEFVNRCFDLRAADLVDRLLKTTLGMHLINQTAFDILSVERKVRLFRAAAVACRARSLSGYHAGAFVIGSLVDPGAPVVFWESFRPDEVAFLLNEWVLHQKYLDVLEVVGEKRVGRAREIILGSGFGALSTLAGAATRFVPLKLSRVDLDAVRAAVPPGSDLQCAEALDVLRRPFGELYDFTDPYSVNTLRRICEREGVPFPAPGDR